jgi:hypothetical protein
VARSLRLFLGLRRQNEGANDQGKCEQDTPHRDLRKLNAIANPEAYQIDDVRGSRTSYSGFSQKPLPENDGADPENLLLWVNRRLTGNCYLINSPELLERVEENRYR